MEGETLGYIIKYCTQEQNVIFRDAPNTLRRQQLFYNGRAIGPVNKSLQHNITKRKSNGMFSSLSFIIATRIISLRTTVKIATTDRAATNNDIPTVNFCEYNSLDDELDQLSGFMLVFVY